MKVKRKAGVLVHPTSLPSDFGIGDFGLDAYSFIDFLKNSAQSLWQILPLNPTGHSLSPYQSTCSFAGDTMLISPQLLAKEGYLEENILEHRPNFNLHRIDYEACAYYKNTIFKLAYKGFKENANAVQKKAFIDFCEKSHWLDDYTLFMSIKGYLIKERKKHFVNGEYEQYCSYVKSYIPENELKNHFFGGSWFSWPHKLATRDENELAKYRELLSEDIEYHKFLQFEFFRQWFLLKAYANKNQIEIIGDLPIFISADSSEYWGNKELFITDEKGLPTVVAGVPPDYFSETGQLWGNPLYDFPEQAKDSYCWWVKRFKHSLNMTDIVRIDHFRGFEAYWQVSVGEETAENGKWVKGPGVEFFKAMEAELGTLNVIAEDLGIITPEVNKLRRQLGFPGMKILHFAFQEGSSAAYLPHNYTDSNFVVYTGTHDNDTTKGWYEKASENEKDFIRRYLNISGENISWDLIRAAYASTADTAIIPVQDIMSLGEEARMNVPGIADGNWRFRFTKDMLTESMAQGLKYLCQLFGRYTKR